MADTCDGGLQSLVVAAGRLVVKSLPMPTKNVSITFMRPPRICVLTGNFYPVVGGGEKHALLLCRELIRQGVSAMVITRRSRSELPAREIINDIPVTRVGPPACPRLGKYLMLPAAIRELGRQRDNYDIIYVCGMRVLGWAGLQAARNLGKPCILRSEALGELSGDFVWRRNPGAPPSLVLKTLFQPLIRWRNRHWIKAAAGFVSISTPVRAEYLACGVPPDIIHDIPNGIDTGEFTPATAEERHKLRRGLNLPPDAVIGAYSGKLNRGKGLQFLLKLWRRVAVKRSELHLLLIGGGDGQAISCEPELRDFIKSNNMEKQVVITGYTRNVPGYLRTADFFLFPSESETLGLALIEALACRLPTIATRIPGISDIIQDGVNGLLAAPNSMMEWENAIARLLENMDLAERLGRAGRTTVESSFSINKVAKRHREMFAGF